jgi:hypothetical protein
MILSGHDEQALIRKPAKPGKPGYAGFSTAESLGLL